MQKIFVIMVAILFSANLSSVSAQKSSIASGPNIGVGLRLGDPLGISLKKYMGSHGLELNLGRSHMFSNARYYDKRFNEWYGDWHKDYIHYKDFHYLGYTNTSPVSLQLHYLFQKDLKQIENLQWYWGIGPQIRFQKYTYKYQYKLEGNPNWFYSGETITDLDLGVDGVLGLEYTLPDLPISIFGDCNLFLEVADNPFLLYFQGGLGARYNF